MLIDWFTVLAQACNFIILVWLMKRFLYKPVLDTIDEREKRNAADLADAASKNAEAERERDLLRKKNEEFDRDRAALSSQAAAELKVERQRLFDEARKDAQVLRAKREAALKLEEATLRQEITRRTREEVFAIARKTLADLASAGLEDAMAGMLIGRLRALTGEEKAGLSSAFNKHSGPATVRSAFELPAAQRSALEGALEEALAAKCQLRFETAPALINGIEISTTGWKASWNIDEYLSSLGKSVEELVDAHAEAPAKEETRPEAPRP